MSYVFRADSPGVPAGVGTATRLTFVGPFETDAAAGDFFRTTTAENGWEPVDNPNNPHDDPRWWVMNRVELVFDQTRGEGDLYAADMVTDEAGFCLGIVLHGPFEDEAAMLACSDAFAWDWQSCRLAAPPTIYFVSPEEWMP